MPAEWEPHEATWLGWPHEVTDWPGKFATIPWAFAEIIRHLSQVERVYLLVENGAAESRVRSMLKKSGANLVCRLLLEKKKKKKNHADKTPKHRTRSLSEIARHSPTTNHEAWQTFRTF